MFIPKEIMSSVCNTCRLSRVMAFKALLLAGFDFGANVKNNTASTLCFYYIRAVNQFDSAGPIGAVISSLGTRGVKQTRE